MTRGGSGAVPIERSPVGKARFVLLDGETLAQGMTRILLGELIAARQVLEDASVPRVEAVHRARRHLKWVRSLWFALAPVPGANRDKRLVQVRDTARLLAGARDADVMAAEAHRLHTRAEGRSAHAVARLTTRLDADARAAHEGTLPIEAVVSRLRACEADARSLPTRYEAGLLLSEALVASYRRGRRDWRAIDDGASAEALHDWRKRVKQRRHLSAIVPILTAATSRSIQADLDELGEILGEEHDLAVLKHRLEADSDLIPQADERAAMFDLVAKRRRELKKAALALGEELYGAKTRVFAEDLEALRDL